MQDFSVAGGQANVWRGPILENLNEILLLGKYLKFGVIFRIKINKNLKYFRENAGALSPIVYCVPEAK